MMPTVYERTSRKTCKDLKIQLTFAIDGLEKEKK
jgi:hypothetical protein